LKDTAAVQKWAARKRTQTAIGAVLDKAGLAPLTPTVLDILAKASPDQVKEVDFAVGDTMVWMAFRRGGTKPDIVRNLKWGGKKPFPGYMFVIDDMVQTYTFILPKPCANLTLVSSEPSREKARLDAEKAAKDKADADRIAAEKAAAERARLDAERRERERVEAERIARQKADADRTAAERAAAEKLAAERAEAARVAKEHAAKNDFFFSPLFGKERRTRDVNGLADETLCSPLLGVKTGVQVKMNENFKIAPAFGAVFNFERAAYSTVFAEAEFNYYTAGERSYVGAGLGLWDIVHASAMTPSIGVQFGTQLWTNAKDDKLYFVGEGRMFTRQRGNGLSNNYQFWGGIRYVVR
jgi:hypothetical protein